MRSMKVVLLIVIVCATISRCEEQERVVRILQGLVRGYKDQENEVFAFYGIPYATVPTGEHKFQVNSTNGLPQCYYQSE